MYNQYRCNNCNYTSNEPFSFCKECGQKAQESCSCGAKRFDNAKFCTRCGASFPNEQNANNMPISNGVASGSYGYQQPSQQYQGYQNNGYMPPNNQGYQNTAYPTQNSQSNQGWMPNMGDPNQSNLASNNPYMERYGAMPLNYGGVQNPYNGGIPFARETNRYVVTPIPEDGEAVVEKVIDNGYQEGVAQSFSGIEHNDTDKDGFVAPKVDYTGDFQDSRSTETLEASISEVSEATKEYDNSSNESLYINKDTAYNNSTFEGVQTGVAFDNTSDIDNKLYGSAGYTVNGQDSSGAFAVGTNQDIDPAAKQIEKRKKRDNRFLKVAFVGFWSLTAIAGVTVLIGFVLSVL